MVHPAVITRILIVDDDEKFLASMRRIMQGYFEIVTTKDPIQALRLFEYQGPFAAVISDYRMPLMNGIELFSRLLALDKNVQRIMLTGHAELQMAIDAVNHGKINAFLTKPTPAVSIRSVIAEAIRAYNRDAGNVLPPKGNPESHTRAAFPEDVLENYDPLTLKEKEVLALLTRGCSNSEISAELNITVGTVKSHVSNLFGKLDVNSRSKVIVKSITLGLIRNEFTGQQNTIRKDNL